VNKDQDINDRVLFLMEYLNLSKTAFAASIGINASVLSHIASKRNKPSIDMVMNIADKYPKVSGDWLLTGNGRMIKDESSSSLKEVLTESMVELELLNEVNHQTLQTRIKSLKERVLKLV